MSADGKMTDARVAWWEVHALLQRMFRKAEWYRVQDHEVSSWAKAMQTTMSNLHRN